MLTFCDIYWYFVDENFVDENFVDENFVDEKN